MLTSDSPQLLWHICVLSLLLALLLCCLGWRCLPWLTFCHEATGIASTPASHLETTTCRFHTCCRGLSVTLVTSKLTEGGTHWKPCHVLSCIFFCPNRTLSLCASHAHLSVPSENGHHSSNLPPTCCASVFHRCAGRALEAPNNGTPEFLFQAPLRKTQWIFLQELKPAFLGLSAHF